MPFNAYVDTSPISGKNWTLSLLMQNNTAGIGPAGSAPFTCASAVISKMDFTRNGGFLSTYSHQGPSPVPIEERYELYAKLVERFFQNTYMVTMVGVINGGTKARAAHYLKSEAQCGYHTADFANYLIENGIGVVIETPMFVNTYHSWDAPSMCQAWYWFSPSIVNQGALVEHTGGIYGLDKVPRWLPGSDVNKKRVLGFDGLVSPTLAAAKRHSNAAATWNTAIQNEGLPLVHVEEPIKETKWKKVS